MPDDVRVREGQFADRYDAGRVLAQHLPAYRHRDDVLMLALPRGGVPVASAAAAILSVAFDAMVVRKLGVPWAPELAMGAVASGGLHVLNEGVIHRAGVSHQDIERVMAAERRELVRREAVYRQGRPAPDVRGRVVILIDDGLATGSTMRAAARAVREGGPARVVAAVPVGAPESCAELLDAADEVVCALVPPQFTSVGQWYVNFAPTSDAEVIDLMAKPHRNR